MRSGLSRRLICIVGPTATGKSDVAQCVAEYLDGEVVSADSMQVYRGMDIGTGKVPRDQRRVAHHCIDIVDPGNPYSAALYQDDARSAFQDVDARGKRIVLCGGTGFYVRAAIDDYQFPAGEQVDNPLREKWLSYAADKGKHALWEELARRDGESARMIPENDVKRVVRAFELLEEGNSYAAQRARLASIGQWADSFMVGLRFDTAVLRERIDERVDSMIASGLVKEVEALLERGFRDALTAREAIGYKEIVGALEGRFSLEEGIACIKTATHRYAKRQRTWFRKDERIRWIDAVDRGASSLADEICSMEAVLEG